MHVQRKIDVAQLQAEAEALEKRRSFDQDELVHPSDDSVYARALQYRLVEAYVEAPVQNKLPVRQRLAVIVGATTALWAMIGFGIYLAL
jgi:hypothetical protein